MEGSCANRGEQPSVWWSYYILTFEVSTTMLNPFSLWVESLAKPWIEIIRVVWWHSIWCINSFKFWMNLNYQVHFFKPSSLETLLHKKSKIITSKAIERYLKFAENFQFDFCFLLPALRHKNENSLLPIHQ